MTELDDLHLDKSPDEPLLEQPATGPPPLLIPILAITAIVAIGIAVLLWAPTRPRLDTKKPTPPAGAAMPSAARPKAEPGDNIDLPPLDQTDPLVRQLVSKLSMHPRVVAWLATDGLLRNFAVVVANIADGTTPIKNLSKQRPTVPFSVRETAAGVLIDPASYRRYDAYADAVAGLDARGTARLYATLKPRIADALRDLGYPEGDADAVLARAFGVLLRTPRVSEPVAVKRTSVTWVYGDPALESLPAAERQLLRMGPRNQALIQNKLREIAPYLGMDPARLPPP